jgi:hypothetical protein
MRERRLLQDAENDMIGAYDRIDISWKWLVIILSAVTTNTGSKYMQHHIMELFSDSERFFELVLRLASRENKDMSLSKLQGAYTGKIKMSHSTSTRSCLKVNPSSRPCWWPIYSVA